MKWHEATSGSRESNMPAAELDAVSVVLQLSPGKIGKARVKVPVVTNVAGCPLLVTADLIAARPGR